MQHKTAWNFALAGSNRLRELLKLCGCDDVVAPVDEDAFGRRASELIRRGLSRRWAAKLQAAGITVAVSSLDDFSKRMPFTFKQELVDDQRESPPYGSNLSYSIDRYTRLSQTSATTGKPMRWLDTPADWEWMLNNWRQVYQAAEVSSRDRIFFAFSFAPFLGFWTAFESAVGLGCLCLPGGGLSSAARLRMIFENEITVLCCAPTYALRLAEVAAHEEVKLSSSKVRRIIVAGEPGGSIPGACGKKGSRQGCRPLSGSFWPSPHRVPLSEPRQYVP